MKMVVFIIMLMASNCWGGGLTGVSGLTAGSDISVRCNPEIIMQYNQKIKQTKETIESYIKHHKEHPEEKVDSEQYLKILNNFIGLDDEFQFDHVKSLLNIYYLGELNYTLWEFWSSNEVGAREFIRVIIKTLEPTDLKDYTVIKSNSISEDQLTKASLALFDENINFSKWCDSEWYSNFKETNSLLEETLYNILKMIKTYNAQIKSITQIINNLEQNIEIREGKVYYTESAAIGPQEYLEILNNFNSRYLANYIFQEKILKLLVSVYYYKQFNGPLRDCLNNDITSAGKFITRVIRDCRPSDLKSYDGEKVGSISKDKIETIVEYVNRLHISWFNNWWDSEWYKNFKETNSLLEEILYKILTSRRETCAGAPMNISNARSITMASLMPSSTARRSIDGSREPQLVHRPTDIATAWSITMASLMPRYTARRSIDGSREPQLVHRPTDIATIYDESDYSGQINIRVIDGSLSPNTMNVGIKIGVDDLKEALFPSGINPLETRVLHFKARSDGHFYINAQVNGKEHMEFMVDTGATYVILDSRYAQLLGYNSGPLININIKIDDIVLNDIPTFITDSALTKSISILGVSFLQRLKNFYIKGEDLYITAERDSPCIVRQVETSGVEDDKLFALGIRSLETQVFKFKASADGHFYITALINKKKYINFLVDTGATYVMLAQSDALELMIDWMAMDHGYLVNTLIGNVDVAVTNIIINLHGIEFPSIPTCILKDSRKKLSTLGMSFLNKLTICYFKGKELYIGM